jgi:hypothetical protein
MGKQSVKKTESQPRSSSVILILIMIFSFIAGMGEVTVGITGNWAGILGKPLQSSVATAVVGSFYALAGLALLVALLTRKKWALWLSAGFVAAEFFGRFYLMIIGIAPSHGAGFFKILVGASIQQQLLSIWYLNASTSRISRLHLRYSRRHAVAIALL